MPKWVLLAGSARSGDREALRRAEVAGRSLARAGYGLVVGSWPGVDVAAADGFLSELAILGRNQKEYFRQFQDPFWKRRGRLGYRPRFPHRRGDEACAVRVDSLLQAGDLAIAMCDAAIMIGGYGGALKAARKFISAGKPVFPIPFSGGESDQIFQELLRSWHDNPIPGLTRTQALRLALPWVGGATPLIELLNGTLADSPDIFISYRRADSGSAVGRLQHDLSEYFGNKRIFVDETRIEPSAIWRKSIERGIEECRVGLIVIGKRWLDERLHDNNDILRWEVSTLLEKKVTLPILVDDAGIPSAQQLPQGLERLPSIQATPISNATWHTTMAQLIKTIEGILSRPA